MAIKWGCLERLEVINVLKIVFYYLLGSNSEVKGVELIFYLEMSDYTDGDLAQKYVVILSLKSWWFGDFLQGDDGDLKI